MIGSALALVAAAGFGTGDFLGGLASRRVSPLRVLLVSTPLALVGLTATAVATGGPIHPGAVGWGAACGLALGVASWWFYAALRSGPISVVSPLSAVVTAGVPVTAGLIRGERPGLVASVGIVLALVAVVLVSREVTDEDVRPHRFTPKVAWLTIGAGVGFGLNFVFIEKAPVESVLWPLMFARLAATVVVIIIAAAAGDLRLPSGTPMKLSLTAGMMDVGANVAMLLALRNSSLSLGGMLISLFPVVTVLLAIAVLRERVHPWQVVGMAAAVVSVAMITAG
ncbi:DMT family transporter [Mycolicibacter senuensis]|uniref:DMT family transporter n=1 Tax=Mycolicibacter senuensis TaxID=386913 RepID=UPI00197B48C9|nr:DMT family transporter [Mycolicibacter senuensis]